MISYATPPESRNHPVDCCFIFFEGAVFSRPKLKKCTVRISLAAAREIRAPSVFSRPKEKKCVEMISLVAASSQEDSSAHPPRRTR